MPDPDDDSWAAWFGGGGGGGGPKGYKRDPKTGLWVDTASGNILPQWVQDRLDQQEWRETPTAKGVSVIGKKVKQAQQKVTSVMGPNLSGYRIDPRTGLVVDSDGKIAPEWVQQAMGILGDGGAGAGPDPSGPGPFGGAAESQLLATQVPGIYVNP